MCYIVLHNPTAICCESTRYDRAAVQLRPCYHWTLANQDRLCSFHWDTKGGGFERAGGGGGVSHGKNGATKTAPWEGKKPRRASLLSILLCFIWRYRAGQCFPKVNANVFFWFNAKIIGLLSMAEDRNICCWKNSEELWNFKFNKKRSTMDRLSTAKF